MNEKSWELCKTMRVSLENISKSFDGKLLFDNINAELIAGQCLAVTGSNGSGKSTLLKIVAGLIRPSTGKVSCNWPGLAEYQNYQQFTGLISPEAAMYSALTAVENVLFWTKVRGLSCSEAQASEWCHYVGLAGSDREAVKHFSTGMRQRLKLAVMLAINPRLWLLDEPSANLDENGKELVETIIGRAVVHGAAVMLATNESREVGYASSKISL